MNMRESSSYASSHASPYDHPRVKLHTRKPHRKTKTGCLPCKRRKIKCDELKPECDNCTKHSLPCEYAPPNVPLLSPGASLSANDNAELNLVDLELLHHFCNSTAFTLHQDPTVIRLWSINVPQIGFSYDFVMHGILALSALHLGYSEPARRDLCGSVAGFHHKAGLEKATPALSAFTEENASAMYIFSALTCLYAFATSQQTDESVLSGESGVAEWIILSRQSYSIVRIADKTLRTGPLGALFKAGERRAGLQYHIPHDSFSGDESLREVSALINKSTSDPRSQQAYSTAMDELLKIFRVVFALSPETRESSDVFGWPFKLSDDYLELLQQPTQEALVILAFFAVLPEKLGTKWWLEGFGRHLFSKIYPLIDNDHLPWIQWPLKEIEWNPDGTKFPDSSYGTPMDMGS